MTTVYLNGEFIPKERALIPVDDRGFVFGDGIYEVVRAINGQLIEWYAHAERMSRGLAGIKINFSPSEVAKLQDVCLRLVRDNGLATGEGTVYMQVTRGVAPRVHHFPPAGTVPTVYAASSPFTVPKELRENGAKGITFPDFRWTRCDLKTVNLLGAVLARQAAVEAGAYEAILLRDGVMTEGAATNAFAVVGGVLRTHPLSNLILPGITRAVVMEILADLAIPLSEKPVTHAELKTAEELFICGTTTDVTPITTLDGVRVGNGKRGLLTARLQDALSARIYAVRPRRLTPTLVPA
jgi:D-alanine transaminase